VTDAQQDLFEDRQLRDRALAMIEAEQRRDHGIARAALHADIVVESWNASADRWLGTYLEQQRGPFLAEQFVAWLGERLAAPPDPRAWGAVIRRAALKRRIVKVGYGPAASSNNSPKCVWRAAS